MNYLPTRLLFQKDMIGVKYAQIIHKMYIIALVLEKDNIWTTPQSDTTVNILKDNLSVFVTVEQGQE